MTPQGDELEALKTQINLTEYAASRGYVLDRKSSSRNSAVMVHPDRDKIIIAIDRADRHWIYFAIGEDTDNGSIIDFVQKRGGGNLGAVRRLLRPWLYELAPALSRPDPQTYLPDLEPTSRDLIQVRARYAAMTPPDGPHPYLLNERLIPASVLNHPRFAGRLRIDVRRNAVFPHINRDGICGYEIKNRGFTGFAPGGEKGLWCSRTDDDDNAIVICETAIDALSHFAIRRPQRTRYISTAGAFNATQPDLILAAILKLPDDAEIVNAVDNDDGGDRLTAQLEGILAQIPGPAHVLIDDRPSHRGEDWNDVLRASVTKTDLSVIPQKDIAIPCP
jgi:Toprim-like/Protein of unknown function (DUF3991)